MKKGMVVFLSLLVLGMALIWTILERKGKAVTEMEPYDFGGHRYILYTNACDSWEEAKAFCEEKGGYLAVISSAEENDALFSYVRACNFENAYFGYSDSWQEGTWEWVNGESTTYENWCPGEPNNEMTNENYAMFYWKYTDGKWNDGNFGRGTQSDARVFLCEFDSLQVSGNKDNRTMIICLLAGVGMIALLGFVYSLCHKRRVSKYPVRSYRDSDIRSGR